MRNRYAVLLIGGVAALLFIRLGVWQLARLAERRARNHAIESRMDLDRLEIHSLLASGGDADSLAFRRATVSGSFDFDHEIVVVARSRGGVPGVHVVTPLVLAGGVGEAGGTGGAVLVERAWVASPDAMTADLEAVREPEASDVVGVLMRRAELYKRPWGDGWPRYVRALDPEAVADDFSYALYPVALRRTAMPHDAPQGLTLIPLPELTSGPHASYAIQWFAFAVIAVVGSVVLFVRSEATARG